MNIASLQLRSIARWACLQTVPPATILDTLQATLFENNRRIMASGAEAVLVSASNAGQSTTRQVMNGWKPSDLSEAMEFLIEIVEGLIAAGVPPDQLCKELIAHLIPANKTQGYDFSCLIHR